jgi:hypothetical protein
MGDFSDEEANQFLKRNSPTFSVSQDQIISQQRINFTEEQRKLILNVVGNRPGDLKRVVDEIHLQLQEQIPSNLKFSSNASLSDELLQQVLKQLLKEAKVTVDSAISLFPEAESGLRQLSQENFGSTRSASQARKLFQSGPEDKDGKLLQVLLKSKRILAYNIQEGTVQLNNKLIWHALHRTEL